MILTKITIFYIGYSVLYLFNIKSLDCKSMVDKCWGDLLMSFKPYFTFDALSRSSR